MESEGSFKIIMAGALAFVALVSILAGGKKAEEKAALAKEQAHVFPAVEVGAKAAYVYDLREHKVLYEKNADARLPLASLTKLMSALVASDLAPSYGTIEVPGDALKTYGDSGLKPGEKWSLQSLLDFSLVSSSNDGIAAVALSLAAVNKSTSSDAEIIQSFVSAMNEKASALGLKNTYFFNPTGLDESNIKNGGYASAKDITTLLSYIVTNKPELLEATREPAAVFTSLDNVAHAAKNTDAVVADIPGILASKTGFTDIAGGNLTFAFDPELGHPIVVTILGSTADGRFDDAKALVNGTLRYLTGN